METTATQVHLTRIFDAPRSLVFKAWTDQKHLERWFAPQGSCVQFKQLDIRAGGTFLYSIRNTKAQTWSCTGEYKTITAPDLIEYTLVISDEHGNPISSADAGMDAEWPTTTTVTITLSEHNGRTTLTLQQTAPAEIATRCGAVPGWNSMLEKLAQSLG